MPSQDVISAAEELRNGGVVAFPTETVYGLGADVTNHAAVLRVFALKGRPAHNPLIVHVADESMATTVAGHWPEAAKALARSFWPGPLSIVVEKAELIPPVVTAGGSTVCVRCPLHPTALALIEESARPLVGPSANPSGGVSPTTAAHVRSAFPDLTVLDGGPCQIGIESTVVRFTDDGIEILRPGAICAENIEQATGLKATLFSHKGLERTLQSPGLLSKHYAPTTRTRIVFGDELLTVDLNRAVVLTQFDDPDIPHKIVMPTDAHGYAARLYDALRSADELQVDEIIIVAPTGDGPPGVWLAIADRISRASATDENGEP